MQPYNENHKRKRDKANIYIKGELKEEYGYPMSKRRRIQNKKTNLGNQVQHPIITTYKEKINRWYINLNTTQKKEKNTKEEGQYKIKI